MNAPPTLEDRLREAFAARAESTTVTERPWSERTPVVDLDEERARRRRLFPAAAVAAATALIVGTAMFAVVRDDRDGVLANETDDSTPTTASTPETTVPLVTPSELAAMPMVFDGPLRWYGATVDGREPSQNGLVCEWVSIDGDVLRCEKIGGFLQSSLPGMFIATVLGTSAMDALEVAGPSATRITASGAPAWVRHLGPNENDPMVPRMQTVTNGEAVALAVGAWQVTPDIVVSFQMTDRSDAEVAAALENLLVQEVAPGRLPFVGAGTGSSVVRVDVVDGVLCYSLGSFTDICDAVGVPEGVAIGMPDRLQLSAVYGWARADVDAIEITFADGSIVTAPLGPHLPGTDARIWVLETPLEIANQELGGRVTIVARDGAAEEVGRIEIPDYGESIGLITDEPPPIGD